MQFGAKNAGSAIGFGRIGIKVATKMHKKHKKTSTRWSAYGGEKYIRLVRFVPFCG